MASSTSLQQQGEDGCVEKELEDTSGVTYPPHAYNRVTSAEVAAKISVTSLVMTLALIGNLLVVMTVWRCRRLRTSTNVYIVSLAVSDLMITLSCTWVHLAVTSLHLDWRFVSGFTWLSSSARAGCSARFSAPSTVSHKVRVHALLDVVYWTLNDDDKIMKITEVTRKAFSRARTSHRPWPLILTFQNLKATLYSCPCPKKTHFAPFGGIPGAIFPQFFCDIPLSLLTYVWSFVQIGLGLGKL